MRMVDKPSPFAPRQEWADFLSEIKGIEAETGENLAEYREAAEAALYRIDNPPGE